jgi:hypothetical protein
MIHPRRVVSAGLLGACTLLTAACSSLDPQPFEAFRQATQQLQAGTNTVLLLDYEWSRRGFVDSVVGGAPEELSTLFLTFDDDDPFEVRLTDPPAFLAINQARQLLSGLASTFSGYAQVLARLAGSEVIRPKTFESMERDLDARLRKATKALEEEPSAGAEGAAGLFSAAASKAFRAYIERRRAEDLRAAMQSTQPVLEHWARLAADAVQNVRGDIKTEYDSRKVHISKRYAETRRGTNAREQRRLIEEMVDLDATVVDAFATLRALRDAFLTMPGAHRQLADSTRDPSASLDEVREFQEHGQHLRILEQRLSRGSKR